MIHYGLWEGVGQWPLTCWKRLQDPACAGRVGAYRGFPAESLRGPLRRSLAELPGLWPTRLVEAGRRLAGLLVSVALDALFHACRSCERGLAFSPSRVAIRCGRLVGAPKLFKACGEASVPCWSVFPFRFAKASLCEVSTGASAAETTSNPRRGL